MAADSDGSGESLTTVVTCEGDLSDPDFLDKFEKVLDSLRKLVCEDAASQDKLRVRKLEPWNSVRVTLAIPREAALRLRQLASEGSQQLRALGILSVQVEGDQVISLRIAGRFGQEAQEIVLRTGTEDAPSNVPRQTPASDGASVVSGLTRILSGGSTSNHTTINHQPSTSCEPSTSGDKVQFRSPNVVCPTDTQVPKPPQATQASSPIVGPNQRNYNGPFPFASMTHAAQAIHSRENQSQQSDRLLTANATNVSNNAVANSHPFNQPPPPYPSQPNLVKTSPLLVNLLQNDGAQMQNKMLPPQVAQNKSVKPPVVRMDDQMIGPDAGNVPDAIPSTNSAFASTGNASVGSATKYPVPVQNTNVPTPQLNSTQNIAGASQIRNIGIRLAQPLAQKVPQIKQDQSPAQTNQVRQIRPPAVQQKFPATVPANVQFNNQFPRTGFRGQLNQFGVSNVQPQFSSPPPYPRHRTPVPDNRFPNQQQIQQQTQATRPQGPWYSSVDSNLPIGQPMPNLAGLSQMDPIAQPMPHLGSLNPLLENNFSNITPSLTDLSKSDLDAILPSLDIPEAQPEIPEVPEELTSTGKRRQFLINPLTGEMEPMPSESSSSESENEDGKETDIFNDFNSPLNERSNSIYSDDDTCSTTISRKFDTTDQSDSEATVRSTNSENSVKSRVKSGKNRDRNRDSPGLKKNKDTQPEKIKLRLKLEKSEPVSPAYKVDVSFINTQQPKRAVQNVTKPVSAVTVAPGEELRVPPLHISLRGRNSVVINSEKKKKYPKLNPDGSIAEMKKSKKTLDGLKVKKSLSAKDVSIKSDNLLTTLTKSVDVLQKTNVLSAKLCDVTSPSTSAVELQKHLPDVGGEMKKSDMDDLPLNCRIREPGEILPSSKLQKFLAVDNLKKSKKSNKFNHVDYYREKNLLTGGHMVDEFKPHKKLKDDKLMKNAHKSYDGKLNSHLKKEKLCKERLHVGHVGEIRRGSDSDIVKGLKRHADTNGLLHTEKKRRLSQSEGKSGASTVTESQGVIKSVKLKSSSPEHSERHASPGLVQPVVGSTNVGTVMTSLSGKTVFKSKLQKNVTKVRREKAKDLHRDKTYSQIVAEKLAKQLPTVGDMDMAAKFKKSLLEGSDEPLRHVSQLERKFEGSKTAAPQEIPQRVLDIGMEASTRQSENLPQTETTDDRIISTIEQEMRIEKKTDDMKPSETDIRQNQRLDDKQAGRSPNSGGQGEDSGIESMDALSEKSPNQASQSPHCHADTLMTDTTVIADIKTVKSEKLDGCLTDGCLRDIEAQLAKLDGLPLNGDCHIIKTEPFMKTETLIEKLEGTDSKDLNENKERVSKELLDDCCNLSKENLKVDLSELPLSAAMQDSLKQGNITVTRCGESPEKQVKNEADFEISLVTQQNFNCDVQGKNEEAACKISTEVVKSETNDGKDLDFDPLPIRRKPPLYTYSNPEKQSRDSESPVPNLSDIESENSDSNSECSETKTGKSKKSSTITRSRKQNSNPPMNDTELTDQDVETDKAFLEGFKKNDIAKKAPKSLLEQLLIEIPNEISDKQVSSVSPSVSEKSISTGKSSIRTRSSSKLNSPDISEAKSEKTSKTPKHSPTPAKQDTSPPSPVPCPKTSPKSIKTIVPAKRKRQESESSTQSNVSNDEQHGNNTRSKKSRKCSENAVELIKACMGVDNTDNKNVPISKSVGKEGKKLERNKLNTGLLRKTTQVNEVESSDSDEPLIEIAGKARNKHVATRNKLNSTKSNIPSSLNKTTVPVIGNKVNVADEKIGTRRSVRNNSGATPTALKTRSKVTTSGDKSSGGTGATVSITAAESDANRRKTRSAVSDDIKRRRNSRDGK